jgi:hypothetical protein
MKWNSIFNAAFTIGAALALSACSGSGGGGGDTPTRQQKVPNFNTQSCVFSLQDGGVADMSALNASRIETAAFGKSFNSELLMAVGKASIPSTLAFIPKTNAIVYKTAQAPTQQCSKNLFDSLSAPPTDLQQQWQQAAPEKEDSILMGLYIPKSQVPSTDVPSVATHAAIMLRTNTNRWTLVHEFMHHLFMLEAVAEGYNPSTERQKYVDATNQWNDIASHKSMTTDQKIDALADVYVALVSTTNTQLIHFPLEEVANEIKLKEYLADHKLDFAPASTNWYIQNNADLAIQTWTQTQKLGDNLLSIIATHPGHDAAAKKYQEMQDLISARVQEIENTVRAYPVNRGSLEHDLSVTLGVESHAACSHQVEAKEILKRARGLFGVN